MCITDYSGMLPSNMKRMIAILVTFLLSSLSAVSPGDNEEHATIGRTPSGADTVLYRHSYAFVIGASNYTNGWLRLHHAVKDARLIAEALRKRGFEVVTLFDPDKSALDTALDSISRGVGESEDRFLFYFSGHGETVTDEDGNNQGYILPVEAPRVEVDRDRFLEAAIPMKHIAAIAESLTVRHALFIFDCCFSGAVIPPDWNNRRLDRVHLMHPARQFITAGKKDEEVPDRSIFNYCLLQALDGDADLNSDGYMTASEISVYLRDNVIKRSLARQHPQYGQITDPGNHHGDFIFPIEQFGPALPQPPFTEQNGGTGTVEQLSQSVNLKPYTFIPEINFTFIPGGTFVMGSPSSEKGRDDDEGPQHQVTVKAFLLQTTEVTQLLWKQVLGYNPSYYKGDNRPVEQVSWNEVKAFIRRLNLLDPGKNYRLPSEAEWEYACRVGTDTRFPWGDDPDYHALGIFSWSAEGLSGSSFPVGQLMPNPWGLYDMHGNVAEWGEAWYHDWYETAPGGGDPWLFPVVSHRVVRGGSSVLPTWEDNARRSRSAYRNRGRPSARFYDVGFRLAKDR